MEDLNKKNKAEDKEIVFSKTVKAGKRIYYLDVKKSRKDEMFLAITESKKVFLEEGNVIVVDIRDPEQYKEGHIPTAISIPKHEIGKNTDKLSKDKLTIVYGCSEYCSAAAFACLTLADYEYPCVMMNGGYNAWSEFYRFAVVKED